MRAPWATRKVERPATAKATHDQDFQEFRPRRISRARARNAAGRNGGSRSNQVSTGAPPSGKPAGGDSGGAGLLLRDKLGPDHPPAQPQQAKDGQRLVTQPDHHHLAPLGTHTLVEGDERANAGAV